MGAHPQDIHAPILLDQSPAVVYNSRTTVLLLNSRMSTASPPPDLIGKFRTFVNYNQFGLDNTGYSPYNCNNFNTENIREMQGNDNETIREMDQLIKLYRSQLQERQM